jgi:hypothetical protein
MHARVGGEAVERGDIGPRPVGRAQRLLLAGVEYQPASRPAWSFDMDATYEGPRPADSFNARQTPGATVFNAGLRYRMAWGRVPAMLRVRVFNATDAYAWRVDSGGIQAWEPARRVQLSLTFGE